MGDEHQRGVDVFLEELQRGLGALGVQARGGLVGQHQGGAGDEGAGHGHPLAFSLGEGRGARGGVDAHLLAERGGAGGVAAPGEPQGQLHVVGGAQVGHQRVVLEDEAHARQPVLATLGVRGAVQREPVDLELPLAHQLAAQQAEQRGLAGSRGAVNRPGLAGVDREIRHGHGAARPAVAKPLGADHRRSSSWSRGTRSSVSTGTSPGRRSALRIQLPVILRSR